MDNDNQRNEVVHAAVADRIGFARITRMAFDGIDLGPLWQSLMKQVADGTAEAQKRKEQLEASLKDAQAQIKVGWEKITDQASSKLNEWLKG